MADPASARLTWDKLITIACALASLAMVMRGSLLVDGGRAKQVEENTRNIEKLQAADVAQADRLRTIDDRAIRIETKLDILVPGPKGAQR